MVGRLGGGGVVGLAKGAIAERSRAGCGVLTGTGPE